MSVRSEVAALRTDIEVLRERGRGYEKALAIQADEYDRRLDALNNSHDRIDGIVGKTISREEFGAYGRAEDAKAELALEGVKNASGLAVKTVDARVEAERSRVDSQIAAIDGRVHSLETGGAVGAGVGAAQERTLLLSRSRFEWTTSTLVSAAAFASAAAGVLYGILK